MAAVREGFLWPTLKCSCPVSLGGYIAIAAEEIIRQANTKILFVAGHWNFDVFGTFVEVSPSSWIDRLFLMNEKREPSPILGSWQLPSLYTEKWQYSGEDASRDIGLFLFLCSIDSKLIFT